MANNTFINVGGGTWETAGNWSLNHIPDGTETAVIDTTVAGTYTVTMVSTEGPASIKLNDTTATLSVTSTGIVLGSQISLDAGTLALAGKILGSTIDAAGGVFTSASGVLDGVTWLGPLTGDGNSFTSVNIKDGITLLNAAGTGPGTIDIGSMYMVSVVDATPLDGLTVQFDAFNNEYLNGSNSVALILDSNVLLTSTAAGVSASITGLQLNNHGSINAASSGGNFYIGSSTFDNSGTLSVSNGDHTTAQSNFTNTGMVTVSANGTLTISNGTLSNSSTIAVATAGTVAIAGDIGGGGLITLSSFALADVHNIGGTVLFQDGKDTLRLEAPAAFTGAISGFQKGDKIDLPGQTVTGLAPYVGTAAGGTLSVMNGTTVVAALHLVGNYLGSTFAVGTDGGTGQQITTACYAAGTRIRTDQGEIAVEQLEPGMRIASAFGGTAPLRWVGHRRVDCRRHPQPEAVWPIRIRAGAIADGVPQRDVLLSPDHAVYLYGVLVPAGCLVDGDGIRQEQVGEVIYYHVELPAHDVVLAEGMPAESYLDTGNRGAFANGGATAELHPDFARQVWEAEACAPQARNGVALARIRARLAARARVIADTPMRAIA